MYAVQSTGKHTGLVFVSRPFATREEALALKAKCEKHVGNANLSRTVVTV